MTINAFVARLKETERSWQLKVTGGIRLPHESGSWTLAACPISALGEIGPRPSCEWINIASYLGVSGNDADCIVNAADFGVRVNNRDNLLRLRLLNACGLPTGLSADRSRLAAFVEGQN